MRRVQSYLFSCLLSVLLLVPIASAGYKESAPVQVVLDTAAGTGMAYGSLGSTRSGGAASSYIGCYLQAETANGVSGYCQASDGVRSGSCKMDPLNFEFHLMALRSMTPSSSLVFAWNTQNGVRICTYLTVSASSSQAALQ